MTDAPSEPSRRSRREARAAVGLPDDGASVDAIFLSVPDDAPSTERRSALYDTESPRDAETSRLGRAGASGFVGTWKPLVGAAAALVVAVVVGLLGSVAFDGTTGRSVGSVLAAVVVGGTGLGLMVRTRTPGLFSLRGLDVLWALVLGFVLPFITGVASRSLGFPALAALSPRWLLLGVAAPFLVMLMMTFFAIAFVYPAALAYASTRFSPLVSRVVAGAVSSIAFAVIPIVFAGTVSGMPMALFVGFGIAASVFVGLSGRVWGPLLMGMVFTGVWVLMSIAGYVLA
ncbi:hypothetical protein [Microbacterium hydrothermale]|uniref:hypothetical protein n=1 Tax=Microbacterium hydrothermale TaxID=857427 RepID=UPI0010A820AA|nr:hypothetical protein [Microbacterium hydrothermale]